MDEPHLPVGSRKERTWVYLGRDIHPPHTHLEKGLVLHGCEKSIRFAPLATFPHKENSQAANHPSRVPQRQIVFGFSSGGLAQEAAAENYYLQGWWPTSAKPYFETIKKKEEKKRRKEGKKKKKSTFAAESPHPPPKLGRLMK